ncbi:MAG: SOS response-associated peptidase [Proteobacteria bacterium]|nr:SOS response-associated peptidase [Pseudomonadota bacterium]
MCGRFDTSHLAWRDIHHQLSTLIPVKSAAQNMEPNDDVRPTTRQLVARIDGDGWVVEPMRWGLIPFWYKGRLKPSERGAGDGFKLTTFNARTEDVHAKPTFRGPFAKRRCIVPASGWYEWSGDPKTKRRFSRVDGSPLWFAGIWERATTEDEGDVQSFTILTGPSSGWLSDHHDRAPVILEPDEWASWLDPSQDAKPLMAAVRPDRFALA